MSEALTNVVLAAIILQSLVISYGMELFYRNVVMLKVSGFAGKATKTWLAKSILGLTMSIKTAFFLSFNTSLGDRCYVVARFADIFYHLSMAAGTFVLISRVDSIAPIQWKTVSGYILRILVVLRVVIGIVDTVYLNVSVDSPTGMCIYEDNYYTGPVYTFMDLLIDLYVTATVTYILISHIKQLERAHVPVDTRLYIAIVSQNAIRTTLLSIVNLMSAVFLLLKLDTDAIMLIWPVINVFVILLIGYDSDICRTIRHLQEKYWRRVNELLSSATVGTPLIDTFPGNQPRAYRKSAPSPKWRSTPDLPLSAFDRSTARPLQSFPRAAFQPAPFQNPHRLSEDSSIFAENIDSSTHNLNASILAPPPATLQHQHFHPGNLF